MDLSPAHILYKRPVLLLLLFTVIAYLPVFLPFFHLKNDLVNQNLPTRFVFSESLYSGFEPFWNPYINYGIPQYGDMNSGFWNPIKWMIGSTIGYNIYTITLEEMIYIFIGGYGIYKLSREFFSKHVALLTGIAYMACGYMTGHLQYFCWITGTAFFPFVLLFFVRVNKEPFIRNFAGGAISVFFFISATHPGLIIGAIYFMLSIVLIILFNRRSSLRFLYGKHFLVVNALFLLLSAITGLVVIAGNLEVLAFISRGSKVSLEQTLMAPTTIQSYLSLLFPLPVHKTEFFQTDIAMRNIYIGVAHLAGIFMLATLNRRLLLSFAIPLLFFVLLSAGGLFKTFSWKFIPLTGFVRLNGEFTYFVILILLLGGAAGLQQYSKTANRHRILWRILWLCTITMGACLLLILFNGSSVLTSISADQSNFKTIIRSIIERSTFVDLLFLQSLIQAVTIWLLLRFKNNPVKSFITVIGNFTVITWLTLPFTGLGLQSKNEIDCGIL